MFKELKKFHLKRKYTSHKLFVISYMLWIKKKEKRKNENITIYLFENISYYGFKLFFIKYYLLII